MVNFHNLSSTEKMAARQIYLLIILIVTLLLQSCTNDNKKTPQQTTVTSNAPPTPEHGGVNKSTGDIRVNKTNRIGTSPTGKDAELNQTVEVLPIVAPAKKSTPAGPSGYISRENVILQSEPAANAPKTGSFKIYDQVIILETKMTDETTNASDVPKWYKVQCADKKTGWVVARSVTVN